MGLPTDGVKSPRTYDATRRREQAARVRQRIVEVAEARFLAGGYAATSVADIAQDAEVSVDTIYKSFGGKPGLIRAIYHRALEGQGPVPAGWGQFVAEIAPRATPIALLIRSAAATDPELQALRDELDVARLARMTTNARRLHDAGYLRRGITLDHAANVLWTYSSPELYELLVMRRGMTPAGYGVFVSEAMTAALL